MSESKKDYLHPFGVVILNKHPELAWNLLRSIAKHHSLIPPILTICDGHNTDFTEHGRTLSESLRVDDEFVFARNANLGLEYFKGHDVVLINDDIEIFQPGSLGLLAYAATRYPKCGVMSPLIDGGIGQRYQSSAQMKRLWPMGESEIVIKMHDPFSIPICFPCIYIRRQLIDAIGGLDESFVGYGFDDNDYCYRSQKAGFSNMITSTVTVKHGSGGEDNDRGKNWSVSFARAKTCKSNVELYRQKHLQT